VPKSQRPQRQSRNAERRRHAADHGSVENIVAHPEVRDPIELGE
jgi:hypothetical protein